MSKWLASQRAGHQDSSTTDDSNMTSVMKSFVLEAICFTCDHQYTLKTKH